MWYTSLMLSNKIETEINILPNTKFFEYHKTGPRLSECKKIQEINS